MSDNDGKKTLGLRGGGPRSGNVKQSFSHGRTKNVVVETKRKRVVVPKPGAANGAKGSGGSQGGSGGNRPAGISDAEMERRLRALQAAKAREVEETAQRAADEKARAEERERMRAEKEQKEREQREAEEKARLKAEEEERRKREEAEAAKRAEAAAAAPAARPAAKADAGAPASSAAPRPAGAPGAAPGPTPQRKADREREERGRSTRTRDDGARRAGKLTLNQALGGEGGRQKSMAAMKRKQERARQKAMGTQNREKVVRDVQLPEAITVAELANRMAERVADVVKSLMQMGIMATQNQSLDADTAEMVIEEFGHRVTRVSDADVEDVIQTA
ncbi:MAG TPA: translation initiation factor IF-2, partial [Citreicella sp.]|nr:translation initiation factor IF-2 [Citreicella sp.]